MASGCSLPAIRCRCGCTALRRARSSRATTPRSLTMAIRGTSFCGCVWTTSGQTKMPGAIDCGTDASSKSTPPRRRAPSAGGRVSFPSGEKADDRVAMYLNDVFTIPVNLAGNAAVSVPAGLSDGLPVGLQLIAPALGEATMLRAAWAFEQDLGLPTLPQEVRSPDASHAEEGRA